MKLINLMISYICFDLFWIPNKSTYTKEIYDCYPKNISLKKFEKMETLKFYGYAISKFKYNKSTTKIFKLIPNRQEIL